jgi:hypothetical protein
MKQLPDIVTSVGFWASVGTLVGVAGAWATYALDSWASRRQDHAALLNLIAGIDAELALVSEWAGGDEGNQGYLLSKPRGQLLQEHPDWFYPNRRIFTFETPALSSLTNSPYAKSVGALLPSFVRLNHSIRRLLDYTAGLHTFVMVDLDLYMGSIKKLSPKSDPAELVSSTTPEKIFVSLPSKNMGFTEREMDYLNYVFGMNEKVHQQLIGGAEGPPGCLYLEFRSAKKALEGFKSRHLKPARQPWWYWVLHFVAAFFFFNGVWQVLRWFEILPRCFR